MTEYVNEKGMTLLELLVAIGLASIVFTLGASVYIMNSRQFMQRTEESELFMRVSILNSTIERRLFEEPEKCNFGRFYYKHGEKVIDLKDELMNKDSTLKSVTFKCYVNNPLAGDLSIWKSGGTPELIEYSGMVEYNGKEMMLLGSVLK